MADGVPNPEENETPPTQGLTHEEAERRLHMHGLNEISQEQGRPAWHIFVEQLKSPFVVILFAACLLSGFLGEWLEVAAIGTILVINAVIGFFQEYKAEAAIEALRDMTAPRAKVLRQNTPLIIPAHNVVPGDFLLLEAGDLVAADADILVASHLQINEAVLTGESVPVEKDAKHKDDTHAERRSMVFMGTAVATGTATARVFATGMRTELGNIARLLKTTPSETTPLQKQLAQVAKTLLILCIGIVALVAVLGWFQGRSWPDLLIFCISLMVAAVPEGMPVIVTVALALGVQRMAERRALIRRLPSVETLGSVSVICTDKTGTLTTGNMRVRELWGDDHTEIIRTAAACVDAELGNEGREDVGDPTEIAILLAARERGILKTEIERINPRLETEPFDSKTKRMSILRQDGFYYVKGAVETLLPLCSNESKILTAARNENEEMTSRGLRVLAVAKGKEKDHQLMLTGLIAIADPPRSEVADAIREAQTAGILPLMITGDHPRTAAAIAYELGLACTETEIKERVHARTTPEEKLRIVRSYKEKGAIVAMTGDGVNDAPALKEAHIGIAMGQAGTEVTRQSADLILADDNFATIVAAVREGRGVYQNIRKAIIYLLTGNFAELACVVGALAIGLPVPFVAAHLLWINLVTDSLPGLALIADPVNPQVMQRPPRPIQEALLGRPQWRQVAWVGILEATVVLFLFYEENQMHGLMHARNLAFTTIVFSQLFRSFAARSQSKLFWEVGALSNLWLLAVVSVTGILQLSLHFFPLTQRIFHLQPITLEDMLWCLPLALIPVSCMELQKIWMRLKSTSTD